MYMKLVTLLAVVAAASAARPNYNFQYNVRDSDSRNDFGHEETRNLENTNGAYFVQLPDGRLQQVSYRVDGDSGFLAEVSYKGDARFPDSDESFESRGRRVFTAPSASRSRSSSGGRSSSTGGRSSSSGGRSSSSGGSGGSSSSGFSSSSRRGGSRSGSSSSGTSFFSLDSRESREFPFASRESFENRFDSPEDRFDSREDRFDSRFDSREDRFPFASRESREFFAAPKNPFLRASSRGYRYD